ncbi:MAG: Flp pilus assembly complex ATPase component TadA [Candidatus Omnitrophica bacterium]|nr:Flp pilus assembly complex ATPase component TadA [Candidatus Omnitrophota bacterium]
MIHQRLGEILIKQGLITENQLQQALEAKKLKKERIGETFFRLGMITEADLVSALAMQLRIPYASNQAELMKPRLDQELDKLVPFEFARRNIILPLVKNTASLTCAVFDPLDYIMLDNLKQLTNCELSLVIATKTDLIKAIDDFYGMVGRDTMLDQEVEKSYGTEQLDLKEDKSYVSLDAELSINRLVEKAEEAPVIKLVDLIIRQAIDEKASDIHIEPFKDKLEIRYRIDGVLYQIPPPAAHLQLALVSRVKILSRMDISEKRLPQDGNISCKLEDRIVDLRVSSIPTIWGEKVVMRILDRGTMSLELGHLGFDAKQLTLIRKSLEASYGLFFVTGPTGSGKSTTLYAALNEVKDTTKNILTVEDPVEYKIDGINQVAVRADIGLTFAAALRAFLRQDPDIILVGEVRDMETAQICVRAALTGHMVLSTLHTNDAPSAISRLIDIGVPYYLLPPSLCMVIGQRLVRVLCPKCKEAYEPNGLTFGDYKIKSDLIYRAKGCDECSHTGYRGRKVIAEVMAISDKIRALLTKNSTYEDLRDAARKNGMETLFEVGMRRVEEGLTSLDEILGIVTIPE